MKRHRRKIKKNNAFSRLLILGLVLIFAVVGATSLKNLLNKTLGVATSSAVTPIEQSGLTPQWKEDFTDGKMDRFQFSWAKDNPSALDSKLRPGEIYLGKKSGSGQVEQELFNFKGNNSTWARTIEFDVFSPQNGNGRVSLRQKVGGDFVHLNFGLSGDVTKANFRFGSQPSFTYSTPTGPNQGWAHVVASYEQVQVGGNLEGHYVIAINGEVKEYQGTSNMSDYNTYWENDPNAVEWNIEAKTEEDTYGSYIKNVRGYKEFISLSEMPTRVANVDSYRSSLGDPRNYSGTSKVFQSWKTLTELGPNALMYSVETGPLTVEFDGSLSSAWKKITSYNWDFGDGFTGEGKIVSHTYSTPGTYQVNLSVTSQHGTSSHILPVTVSSSASATPTPTAAATPTPTATPSSSPTPTSTPSPSSVTLNPVADTFVNANAATRNYGTKTLIEVDGKPIKITYLKFNIPAGSAIISGKIRVYVSEGSVAVENIKAVSDVSWSETGMNFNNKPALGISIGSIPQTPVTGSWVEVDLSSFLSGKSGQTISIGIDSSSGDGMGISSRESSNKPVLELRY